MAEKEKEEKQREIEKKENEEMRKYMYYVQIHQDKRKFIMKKKRIIY